MAHLGPRRINDQITLLHDGLSSTVAVLDAIHSAGLFAVLPTAPDDRANHENGCWLLAMLSDRLADIRKQVASIDAACEESAS